MSFELGLAAAGSRPGCEGLVMPKIVFGHAPRRKAPFECGSDRASVQRANPPDGREGFFFAVDDEPRDAVVDHLGYRAAPEYRLAPSPPYRPE